MKQVRSVRRVQSNRKATHFAITIPHTAISKIHAFEALSEFCNQLLICQELHKNGDYHHHIYMRTNTNFTRFEIKQMVSIVYNINSCFDNDNLDGSTGDFRLPNSTDDYESLYIDTVRNVFNYIGYITKEDSEPLYKGIGLDRYFSFYARVTRWSQSVKEFDITDSFVLNNPQFYKLLREVIEKTQEKKTKNTPLPKLNTISTCHQQEMTWQDMVLDWWNDWVVNGFVHKKKQLYLWGPSNIGKTSFIMNLFKIAVDNLNNETVDDDAYEAHLFRPTPNEPKYSWQDFEFNKYNLVLIDEFDVKEFKVSDLKKALAGESFIANVKNGKAKNIKIQMPTILISNLAPPSDYVSDEYRGLCERLFIVHADQKYY